MHISADFITKLPLVQGYNSILVVVDRLMKMVYLIPTIEKTLVEGLARLFRNNVWKWHRLLESIILDRGPQFMAGLIRELNKMLEIKSKMSTAFHPQIDRQIERVSQELEQCYESPKKEIVSHTFKHLIHNLKSYNGIKT